MKTSKKKRIIESIITFVITVCMVFSVALPVSASEEDVRAVADGVLYLTQNIDGKFSSMGSTGTCFLINEDTVITANHCVHFTNEEYKALYDEYGLKQEEVDELLTYTVTIQSDFTIPATLVNSSENMDFAILKLSQPISNRTFLKLRDSKTVKAAETVYSVGYPAVKDTTGYHNQKDISFESGTVNKTQYTSEDNFRAQSRFLESGVTSYAFRGELLIVSGGTFTAGSSGGPLVDSNGNVVGVCVAGDSGSCYASAIDQVMEVLDATNIKYTKAGESADSTNTDTTEGTDASEVNYSALQASISKAEDKVKDDYTAESYQKLSDALVDAKAALNAKTQDEVDAAKQDLDNAINNLEAKAGMNYTLIIAIAVAALIIAIIIVLIVIVKRKNKEKAAIEAPVAPAQPKQEKVPVGAGAPVAAPVKAPVSTPASDETSVLSGDGSETTVLSADGGETTVLSQKVNGGKLIRSSNNENIPITYSGFAIGRKRQEVDYCVSDNSNVGRNHAKFIVRDGVTYIVDNKSTNGTFVNNTSVRPGQEVELKDGDTVMLADEKFIYKK